MFLSQIVEYKYAIGVKGQWLNQYNVKVIDFSLCVCRGGKLCMVGKFVCVCVCACACACVCVCVCVYKHYTQIHAKKRR